MRQTVLIFSVLATTGFGVAEEKVDNTRPPRNEAELEYWLTNMVAYHRYTVEEVEMATGLSPDAIRKSLKRFDIEPGHRPDRQLRDPLVVLPYPGGRHPRIGFLDGAIRPQRETKISVFTPWNADDYVVVDVPEAIWSNLGLTYLAHTHIDTVWTKQGIAMKPLEWKREQNGRLSVTRRLPNGIEFSAAVRPYADGVSMQLELKNGSKKPLRDLRVQNCVMLKGAQGFQAQTNENKVRRDPYIACRNNDRWIITGWTPLHRTWSNERCPCLHADPKFPDCAPGQTVRVQGWLSFYEGNDLAGEIERLNERGWR